MEQVNSSPRIKVGYGSDLLDYAETQKFFVRFDPLTREPQLPFEEAKLAAKEIGNQLGRSLTLCLSGGLDSEAMALAFLAAEVPFDVTTLRFKNDLNLYDIERAAEFCRKHSICQHFIELDVVNFFENKKFLPYVESFFCPSPEVATQIWFAEQLNRPFVWGGEAFRLFANEGQPVLQAISEVEAIIFRFVKTRKYKAVPNFHFYNPELAWAFLKVSTEYKSTFFENDRCSEYYQEKESFYRQCGFPLIENRKRNQKLHGFEGLKNYMDLQLSSLKTTYNDYYRIPQNKKYPLQGRTYLDIQASDRFAKRILNFTEKEI